MFSIQTLLILVPALPLAAALLTAVLGRRVLGARSHVPVVAAIGLSCLASLVLLVKVDLESRSLSDTAASSFVHASDGGARNAQKSPVGYEKVVTLWTWATVPGASMQVAPIKLFGVNVDRLPRDFNIEITLRADPLTAVMLLTVTFISLLVAVYSVGYMRGDPGYWRFFTYIALFVFSMTMLVSASNFVLLYVFWEGVGLCSYLLIGFWFQKPAAAAAGKKAFLVNRIGDFGFAIALFLLWTTYGTLDFHDTGPANATTSWGVLGQARLAAAAPQAANTPMKSYEGGFSSASLNGYVGGWLAMAICLLLMLGACGKSAQFPLHVWLPDAMEGPTPVSALIHAATMVTAGVYMVVRCMPLFAASPEAVAIVAVIGAFTALMAAVIALTQTDLKRILAYSTISQLGYMFLGLGAGTLAGATAGMFHLITHAFFKALLFLGAGSVMHAMGGVIDLRRLGGLRRRMPVTHATFLVGCLALAGVFPFAGFWSKDTIFAAVDEAMRTHAGSLYPTLYYAALATALLTAFYTFRAFFLTFYGEERIPHEAGHHAHESPAWMTVPLVLLAIGSFEVGWHLELTRGLEHFLARTPSLAYMALAGHATAEAEFPWRIAMWSTAAAAAGIGLAWLLYLGPPGWLRRVTAVANLTGLYRLSYGKMFFDQAYNLVVVWPLEGLAALCAWLDRVLIDGLVDLCGRAPAALGSTLRPFQSGLIQFYALAMILGLLALLVALLM